MEALPLETLLVLIGVAGVAGMVDAIAGGGGLLALPALLWAGLPPVQALATNKLQGTFGTLTASVHFIRKGEIDLARLQLPIALTAAGSVSGTLAVQHLGSEILRQIVPVLLITFALYFLFSPRIGDQDAHHRISHGVFGLLIGLVACSNGFAVEGGSEGLGRATTRSVVLSIAAIVIADMVFTYFLTR